VLFRAYGQRVLRESLIHALDQTTLPVYAKQVLATVVRSTDLPVLAYDRTIRAEIDQSGAVEVFSLKRRLRQQLEAVHLSDDMQNRFLALLDSKEFFAALSDSVKQNGEIFGAYRAIGNGGVPLRVLEAFLGRKGSVLEVTSANLRKALLSQEPAVAGTFFQPAVLPPGSDKWYAPRHAYTVVRF